MTPNFHEIDHFGGSAFYPNADIEPNQLKTSASDAKTSRVLAGLFLHGKAVKQTVTTRADQRSLAATPGVVG